ncbi:hypothetical protein KR084_010908 [Drosophila pseudotakahashii]|nr:hypothetical protein KR084_010908 [Drosophila pseudotakahashii]
MSQTYEGTETLKIEALEFLYEDELEFLDIETPPGKEDNEKAVKLKRLVCNRNGCTYSTDRRRDMKRHRRSQKHEHEEYQSDSESDLDRSLFTCKVCEYKTAKRFCYLRHKESRRHIMKEMEACEQLTDEEDRAELRMKRRKRVEEPQPEALDSNTSQDNDDKSCNYTTPPKSCLEMHANTQNKKDSPQSLLEPNDYIEYFPQEEEQLVEETEDECHTFNAGSSTMECDVCEYKTARRFAFVRHLQTTRHLTRIQERDYCLETENHMKELDGEVDEHVVEVFDEEQDNFHHDLEEQKRMGDINALTYGNGTEDNELVEIDALERQNGLGEIRSLVEIDGLDQTEPSFDVVEYAAAEENVYEEIVYLPTEDNPEDICYFIALEH